MKRIIIITGASSGIGREFARQLYARKSAHGRQFQELWLVARRKPLLLELKEELEAATPAKETSSPPCSIRIIAEDISGRNGHQIISRLLGDEAAGGIEIDTLINNAGFGTYGPFAETPVEREMELVELNVTSLTGICGAALPYMKRGSSIINVASLAAFIPLGNFAVYSASKAYVRNFSLALAAEVKDKGIHVMALCPGSVSTDFANVASNGARREVLHGKPVDKVVAHALRCQRRGRKVALWSLKWKLSALLSRLIGHYFFARYTYLHAKRPYRLDSRSNTQGT